jgi:hypothetical protein
MFSDFDLHEYRHYYLAENWKISKRVRKTHQLSPSNNDEITDTLINLIILVASNMFMPRLFDQTPPSYLKWARLFLSKSDNGSQLSPFPYIPSVTNRIVLCTKVNCLIEQRTFAFSFVELVQLLATYLYPGMTNAHLSHLCNIASNSHGKLFHVHHR